MIVIMKSGATQGELDKVLSVIEKHGLKPHLSSGEERTIVGILGDVRKISEDNLSVLDGVDRVVRILKPFKLASKDFCDKRTEITVRGVTFSENTVPVIAGPCAIEDEENALLVARTVKEMGARMFRGGAFKPRTSPYSFQGLGLEGLKILAKVREETGMPVCTEVISPQDVELVAEYVDVLQVGARNMQNFSLLQELGKIRKPVILKRGLMSSIEEWIMAAEYILVAGNPEVILCERGIRTYETATRNTLDLSAVAVAKNATHLPVIVDPSHGTGRWELVTPMALAAVACGADGIMVEVHQQPEMALSDGPQSLKFQVFDDMMKKLREIAAVTNRTV